MKSWILHRFQEVQRKKKSFQVKMCQVGYNMLLLVAHNIKWPRRQFFIAAKLSGDVLAAWTSDHTLSSNSKVVEDRDHRIPLFLQHLGQCLGHSKGVQ